MLFGATAAILATILSSAEPQGLAARDFGAVGDGRTDDGPAIGRLLAAASRAGGPVTLAFEPGKVYRVSSAGPSGYVFALTGSADLTLDGGGSEFRLDGALRLIKVDGGKGITLRRLSVDYDPLPFADGLVVGRDPGGKWLDVRIFEEFALPPLGPATGYKDQQAYFAMLWLPGPYGPVSRHFWCTGLAAGEGERVVRVLAGAPTDLTGVTPGRTEISLPVRGVAHRPAAGPVLLVRDSADISVEDLAIWSAPWFACGVIGNRGAVTFRRVAIRPKPGANRRTSSWRDGIHVKANAGRLLFEDCWLEGMNDDAFNIATHGSRVEQVLAPDKLAVLQMFPLDIAALRPGDTILAYDAAGRRLLGRRKLLAVEGEPQTLGLPDHPHSPRLTLTLDAPLDGTSRETLLWDESTANPETTLRRCTVRASCRFQSSVTLDDCDFTALCWFYPETVEGPIPRHIAATGCRFRRGRGNPELAISVTAVLADRGGKLAPAAEPVIDAAMFRDCRIWGQVYLGQTIEVRLERCQLLEPKARVAGEMLGRLTLAGGGLAPAQLDLRDAAARAALRVEP
jgi:hypothetical protein